MFPVKPFLLLATRAEDEAADGEYEAMLRWSGLEERDLHRVRLEAGPLPAIDLDDYAGVIVGGGPFDSSDRTKSATQQRVEAELRTLLDELVARDFPFLGACYGIGTLGVHQGGTIDRTYGEPISAVPVTLTAAGLADPILEGMPETFSAFVGHKEACSVLPSDRRTAGVLTGLPGPDVPGEDQPVCHAVPPRARRRGHHHPDPGVPAQRLLRPRDHGHADRRRQWRRGDPAAADPQQLRGPLRLIASVRNARGVPFMHGSRLAMGSIAKKAASWHRQFCGNTLPDTSPKQSAHRWPVTSSRGTLPSIGWRYLVDDIEVVVSDLVTNSIRDAAVPVAVSLEQMYFGVLLIVGIASGAASEAAPTGATETIGPETWDGGLRLVELLSNEWGVDAGGAGRGRSHLGDFSHRADADDGLVWPQIGAVPWHCHDLRVSGVMSTNRGVAPACSALETP